MEISPIHLILIKYSHIMNRSVILWDPWTPAMIVTRNGTKPRARHVTCVLVVYAEFDTVSDASQHPKLFSLS